MARRRFIDARRWGILVFLGLTLSNGAFAGAHEKWFHDGQPQPTCWCELGTWRPILAISCVAVVTVLAMIVWRWRGRRDFVPGPQQLGAINSGRNLFYAAVPLFLAIHLAVPLMALGIGGKLLSPNNALESGAKFFIALAEIACALSLFYGACTRLAALLLAGIWLAGLKIAGWEPMLENFFYLGYAAFFFLAGRGPYSIDRLIIPRLEPSTQHTRWALPCLRVSVGLSLAFVAFTEKLANPALALSFLQQHHVNFTGYLHIPMCDATFTLICGGVELLVGVWIVLGLFPRTIVLIAFIPFNMTLAIFNWTELVGHLPFYGVLAVLLVWTPEEEDQQIWTRAVALPMEKRLATPNLAYA